jgi:hypothetical protein
MQPSNTGMAQSVPLSSRYKGIMDDLDTHDNHLVGNIAVEEQISLGFHAGQILYIHGFSLENSDEKI